MILGHSPDVIVQRIQMKNTSELVQETGAIAGVLERTCGQGVNYPVSWQSWLRSVWVLGRYEREMKDRNISA